VWVSDHAITPHMAGMSGANPRLSNSR